MSEFSDIKDAAMAYASNTLTGAYTQLETALGVLNALGPGSEDQPLPVMEIVTPEKFNPGTIPVYTGASFDRPSFDAIVPTLNNLPSLVFPDITPYTATSITFEPPVKPSGGASFSTIGPAPDLGDELEVPEAPDLSTRTIPVPDIQPIDIPDFPDFVMPTFEGSRPVISVSVPTNLDQTFRTQFDTSGQIMRAVNAEALDAFLDADFPEFRTAVATLESKLETFLAGGTALTDEVQDRIFARLQDKISVDGQRARDAALNEARQGGWTMFTPNIVARLQTVDQSMRDNLARGATDIAIKQAEMEQSNVQFALQQTIAFRQTALSAAMQYFSGLVQTNGQAIQYAQGVVQAIVATYEIASKIVEMQARIYEADARIFEARLRGVTAYIDAYQAQVRGLEAQANVDVARLNTYKARIEALQAEANIYRASIEAVTAQAQIKRLAVDVYQARTQAYVAQVGAEKSQWEAYEAATRGEVARIDAIKTQEQLKMQQVQVQVEVIKAKVAQIGAVAGANESAVKLYGAQVEAFSALVDAEAKAIQAEVASFGQELAAFVAACQAQAESDRAQIAAFSAGHQAMIETAKLYYSNLIAKAQIHEKRIEAAASIFTGGAQLYANVAQAAVSGLATVASDQTSRRA